MNVIGRLLAVAGVMLAATSIEAPGVFAQTTCGNHDDFPPSPRVRVFGLTDDQRLVRFRECRPDRATDVGPITGLEEDDTAIVGIDFRIQDGQLYGLGDGGGIYTIERATAAATLATQLTEPLDGVEFDIDFNPAADALRIISDTGQNLRHPFSGPTQFQTQVDQSLNIAGTTTTGVSGAAYTNNDLDPNSGTTLFDISSETDQVLIQSPPNDGSLFPTGSLTVDAGPTVGFDIFSVESDGVVVANNAFASLDVTGSPAFYRINPVTGQAILIGDFGDNVVTDIAVRLRQPSPSPTP
jgi:Domain of unknown function (DUF4394)